LGVRRYVRSEGVAAIVLKRSDLIDTPRWANVSPYCTIKNIGINNDGFTKEGITFPSKHAQLALEQQVPFSLPFLTP
jgi:acyl transferase domain-containing protein